MTKSPHCRGHFEGKGMKLPQVRDSREEIALYRAQIIGQVAHMDLAHGDLCFALVELSKQRFRPPQSRTTRTYSVPTLQRWYYHYRQGGLEALKPKQRKDAGHGKQLPKALVELLLDIRREHPSASAMLIRDTLIADGRLDAEAISVSTLRRIYAEHDLPRLARDKTPEDQTQRLRWQAAHPNALWHGDVCHGTQITTLDGKKINLRIHGLLDDASRTIIALEAHASEKEVDMLGVFTRAIQRHGCPDAIYLDNGSTYRGEALSIACGRLEIGLIHAKPYDPQARGKMERFWRTLRGRCLDHLTGVNSLHDVNVRLHAFVDAYYHPKPHAGLLGKSPQEVWDAHWRAHPEGPQRADEARLRGAMTVRKKRRVRNDSTLSHLGKDWEIRRGFFAKKLVTVAHCPLDSPVIPWVEADDVIIALHAVRPVSNSHRERQKPPVNPPKKNVDFNPPQVLLDKHFGRLPSQISKEKS